MGCYICFGQKDFVGMLLNHWYVFKLFNLGIVCQKSNYGYSKWCNLCALCSRDIKKNGKSKPIHSPSPKNELFFRVWCEINYTIASFLWVEIGLSVYWPVSCGGNEFLGKILNLSSYISNTFSVFHAQIGSRVSGSERVNEFEHENWERVRNLAGQVENWAKEFISAAWDRPVHAQTNFYPKETSYWNTAVEN